MSNERIDLTQFEIDLTDIDKQNWLDTEELADCIPELIAELKRCYYEIDLLQEYAKCVECGGRYIGPMDYGLDKHDHSEDCEYRLTE